MFNLQNGNFGIKEKLYQCKELLLVCQQIAFEVNKDVDFINKQIDNNALSIEHNRVINPFPQVTALENKASDFLKNAKMYIQTLAEIFNLLFNKNIQGPHFHEIRDTLLKILGKENDLYKYIAEKEPYIHNIVFVRNKIEHPQKGKEFIIQNYTLLPKNKISPPVWFLTGESPCPIAERMTQIVEDLLIFAEDFFVRCVIEKNNSWIPYMLIEIPETERRLECPIRYEVQIDKNRLCQ